MSIHNTHLHVNIGKIYNYHFTSYFLSFQKNFLGTKKKKKKKKRVRISHGKRVIGVRAVAV